MTPEHNDALHSVQRAHPNVRWVEEDGSVILYREDSKRFIYLVLSGSLIEEDAMEALAKLDAELTMDVFNADMALIRALDEPEAVPAELDADLGGSVPEESPPKHVSESDEG